MADMGDGEINVVDVIDDDLLKSGPVTLAIIGGIVGG
jgi:hypothetical protein